MGATEKAGSPPKTGRRGRPKRQRLELDVRREQLLALGLSIFSDRAYDDVSIDDLAAAAGISKGLVYHYFPTKRDFYVAALRLAARQLLDETSAWDEDASLPPDERVRRGLRAYLDFVARRGKAYLALLRGGVGSDREVASVVEETRVAFAARIVSQMPPGAITPVASLALRGWIGFVEAASIDWLVRREVDVDDVVALAQRALFRVLEDAFAMNARRAGG